MKFTFNGTLDELKETIFIKANEHNKNIVVYDYDEGKLEIGFKRLGYSSGRFFVANSITTENENVILEGETKNIDSNTHTSKIGHFVNELVAFLLAYIFLAIILMIPWAFFKDYISIWIPLLLPVIYLCIPSFSDKKNESKWDKEFIDFMSMFTTYTESDSDLSSFSHAGTTHTRD